VPETCDGKHFPVVAEGDGAELRCGKLGDVFAGTQRSQTNAPVSWTNEAVLAIATESHLHGTCPVSGKVWTNWASAVRKRRMGAGGFSSSRATASNSPSALKARRRCIAVEMNPRLAGGAWQIQRVSHWPHFQSLTPPFVPPAAGTDHPR